MPGAVNPQCIAWSIPQYDGLQRRKHSMLFRSRIEVSKMKKIAGLCALITAAAFLAPPVNAQAFGDYSGEETFLRFCAACHGEKGQGDGPVASGLPITVPDLTRIRQRQGDKFPDEVLRRIIDGRNIVVYHGTRYMPVWGYEFWVEEGADEEAKERVEIIIANLIEYIASIQR
jgi:mono/diheme cytochrome c family protein